MGPLRLLLAAATAALWQPMAAQALAPVSTVFALPTEPTWFENLAVRASGELLVSRVDVPELWTVDPAAGTGRHLLTIPSVMALLGIAEVSPDVFIVGGCNFSALTGVLAPASVQLWEVDLRGSGGGSPCKVPAPAPKTRLVANLPDASLINGVAAWDADSVLYADSFLGQVVRVDVRTGNATVAIADATMLGPTSPIGLGINGVRALRMPGGGTYVHYTSTDKGLYCRIPVDPRTAAPTGPAQVIAQGFPNDDFALAADGTAYLVTATDNTLVRVTLDGRVTTVAGSKNSAAIAEGTSARFGRTARDSDVLYVTATGGALAPVDNVTLPAYVAAVPLGAYL